MSKIIKASGSDLSRRDVLKFGAAGVLTALGGGLAHAQSTPTLEILVANALVGAPLKDILEKEAKVKINDNPFQSSTDVVARLVAPGGTKRYNLLMSHSIFSRGPVLGAAAGQEKTAALDLKKIPNFSQVADAFKDDILQRDGKIYGVPIMWGYDTVIYNTKEVPAADAQSWGLLFEDKYAGRIGWFDTAHQMIMAAALYLGKTKPETMTTAELNEVGRFLISKKKNARVLWSSFAQGANLLASGEIVISFGTIPMRTGLQQKGFPIATAWCKEGVLSFVQPAYIPKDSNNQDAAHAVINAMLGKDYASQLAKASGYLSVSKLAATSLTAEERRTLGYGVLDGSTKNYPLAMPPNLQQWIEVWARVKSA
ncbi:MAG: extracellular solute-binding protein [Pseudomonadota bacterium]